MMSEYVIVGDTDQYKGCLVCVCGVDKIHAYTVLDRMLVNPNENDKHITKGMTNLRVEEVEKEEAWWR